LIELLVVIAIMAALAALLLPVVGAVKKHQYIYSAQAEMAKLETAIDRYKATYGFYPPSPPIPPAAGNPLTLVNQLFYELTGTTNISPAPNPPVYRSLDGSPPTLTDLQVQSAFGVGGFMNCSKPGGGEDASTAKNFLPDLRPKQIFNHTNINTGPQGVNLLTCSVGGPDTTYQPLGLQELNPWRFVCPGINNPGSYDLWIQLRISGKTNLICNWSKSVQIGSPLP
jgi:type II secretory pathway pseudopilin PulG